MIGIIAGSGFKEALGLDVMETIQPETPFGRTSGPLEIFKAYRGRKGVFLARHGPGHRWPPHRIPHRANFWALYQLGVDRVISIGAAGAIDPTLSPGDYLIPDNLMDLSERRTFYDGPDGVRVPGGDDLVSRYINAGAVVHLDFTRPFCPELRPLIVSALGEMGLDPRDGGVYAQTQGPRLETGAEIRALRLAGATAVGMTMATEASLARELGMCFGGMVVITNMAPGLEDRILSAKEVESLMAQKRSEIALVLDEILARVPEERNCLCGDYLQEALQSDV